MLPRVQLSRRPVTRRGVLVGGAAVAALPVFATGCTRHKPHVSTPRENLLDQMLALEDELLASYDAAIAITSSSSTLGRTLAQIRAAHAVHRTALLTTGSQPGPAASGRPTPTVVAPGGTSQMLAATESAMATLRTEACLRAPIDLAPLLASLAASEAAHAALLRDVR